MSKLVMKPMFVMGLKEKSDLHIATEAVVGIINGVAEIPGLYSQRRFFEYNKGSLLEIGDILADYNMLIPSPKEVTSVGKIRKTRTRFWQPYTRFAFNSLKQFSDITDKDLASVTFQLSEEVSRLLYRSDNPTRVIHNKLQYYFKKYFNGQAKGVLSIERSTERVMTNVINNRGQIIPVACQLHVHMLIAGNNSELKRFCGKCPGERGIKNLCSPENNAVLIKSYYKRKTLDYTIGSREYKTVDCPIDAGAADYMTKEFDRPIVPGKRNFSFFGIESSVKAKWERAFLLQQRLLSLIDDVRYQLKSEVDRVSVLFSVIKVLEKPS
ncbi:hypothetical protein RGQ13_01675 [Thalassotalea psychrophila]|uniref:Uncharacterized protein n=1 Tax=Thalassotalea psychrophila TaxID=3065647 RepID=A0ABY9TVC8_9GAMM|nr:hypothetical protein RGQ13_01675 [Colwelliaceae bacterium SQ149]